MIRVAYSDIICHQDESCLWSGPQVRLKKQYLTTKNSSQSLWSIEYIHESTTFTPKTISGNKILTFKHTNTVSVPSTLCPTTAFMIKVHKTRKIWNLAAYSL